MDFLDWLIYSIGLLFGLSMAGYLAFCVMSGVGGILIGIWRISQGKPDPVFRTTHIGEFVVLSLLWLGIMAGVLYAIFG